MSYVLANTSNPLGRRNLGRMGWENLPQPVYQLSRSVRQLNGLRGDDSSGAVTYRIDPRTGNYQFYRTDIKPRGVFMQNTFQHPAPAVMSALGLPVLPIGKSVSASTLQRGRVSHEPMIALRPGVQLSGLGCNCGGRCSSGMSGPRFVRRRRFMGDDISIDPNTGGQVDSDGILLTLPCGPGGQQLPPSQCPKNSSNIPGASDPGLVQQIVQGAQGVAQAVTTPRVVVLQPQQASWFNQASVIGGSSVPNAMLAIGGVLFGALALEGNRGRR